MRIPMLKIATTAIEVGRIAPGVADTLTKARRFVGRVIAGTDVTREDLDVINGRLEKILRRLEKEPQAAREYRQDANGLFSPEFEDISAGKWPSMEQQRADDEEHREWARAQGI